MRGRRLPSPLSLGRMPIRTTSCCSTRRSRPGRAPRGGRGPELCHFRRVLSGHGPGSGESADPGRQPIRHFAGTILPSAARASGPHPDLAKSDTGLAPRCPGRHLPERPAHDPLRVVASLVHLDDLPDTGAVVTSAQGRGPARWPISLVLTGRNAPTTGG